MFLSEIYAPAASFQAHNVCPLCHHHQQEGTGHDGQAGWQSDKQCQPQTPVTGKARNVVSCASWHRINEDVNDRFQKRTLLIIKKLAIDLCFLLEVNTITEIYKWSVGVTPLKAASNSDQGFTSHSDGHPSEPRDKGPRPAGLRRKREPAS